MPDLPRSHLVAYLLVIAVVVVLGIRQVGASRASQEPAAPPATLEVRHSDEARGGVTVHVAGAVRAPGVYRFRGGARVDDAVRRAGGARPRADLTQVNLAAELQDGRQIVVPVRAARAGRGEPAAALPGAAPTPAPVNLNTATLEQLDTLSGVGPATAQKILDYREANGGFSSVEELGQVPGIGDVRLAALRESVTP